MNIPRTNMFNDEKYNLVVYFKQGLRRKTPVIFERVYVKTLETRVEAFDVVAWDSGDLGAKPVSALHMVAGDPYFGPGGIWLAGLEKSANQEKRAYEFQYWLCSTLSKEELTEVNFFQPQVP